MDGSVNLWLFNHEEAVLNYRKSGARISKIHFNDSGSKFGYCDFGGVLSLWRFNSSPDGLHRPYVVRHNTMVIHRCCWYPNNLSLSLSQALQCHNKRAMDFAFLNAGSFISTAGISSDNYNVCFWDLLVPPHKALVSALNCHEDGGAHSIVYSPRHQLLFSGGKQGEICTPMEMNER